MRSNQGLQFNIFKQLSVADKELVHSSMIQFLLEENNNEILQFFGATDSSDAYCHLEVSTGKKLRFDIVLSNEKNKTKSLEKPLVIIENKFKATPTVDQLKLYDSYLKKKDCMKILMVFCKEQIPSVVISYCDKNNWKIRSYISLSDDKDGLIEKLIGVQISLNQPNQRALYEDYKNYLIDYKYKIQRIINSTMIEQKHLEDREIWFKYLLYLQGQISYEIKTLVDEIDFKTTNEGTGHVVPSIAFWFEIGNNGGRYLSIDGNKLKIGVHYKGSDTSIMTKIKEIDESMHLNDFTETIVPKIKENSKSSVASLYSSDIRGLSTTEIIEKASKLLCVYISCLKKIEN
jgi:hypothetical protein